MQQENSMKTWFCYRDTNGIVSLYETMASLLSALQDEIAEHPGADLVVWSFEAPADEAPADHVDRDDITGTVTVLDGCTRN